MKLYVSTAWSEVEDNDLVGLIKSYTKNGIKNIELSGRINYTNNIEAKLLKLQEEFQLNFLIHNYFPPPKDPFILNIISEDNQNRKRSIDFVKDNIKLARKIESPLYTFHAGYVKKLSLSDEKYFKPAVGKIDWEKSYKKFYNAIDDILKVAKKENIKLGLENLFPYNKKENYSIMCTLEEIEEFLLRYKDEDKIGLLIDLGHLNVAANYMDFDPIEAVNYLAKNYKEKIFQFHISQNDGSGDSHEPIKLDGWQMELLNEHDFGDIPVVIEGRDLNFDMIKKINNII